MPTYVYRCSKGHTFELFHSIRDNRVKRCPRCGVRARRVPAAGAGLLFKGSGFYITDYRSSSYREKAKQETSAGSADASGSAKSTPAGATDATGTKPAATGEATRRPAKSGESRGSKKGRTRR